jgi:mannose-6-phosphate isomerase-like protein (cupin superfamily)
LNEHEVAMKTQIVQPDPVSEFLTSERCFILETWNEDSDPSVSIARSRVTRGVTTQLHALDVDERYLIVAGRGEMLVGDLQPSAVGPGDVVAIPAGTPQRIKNIGDQDLVFYCVCSPRFQPEGYEALE